MENIYAGCVSYKNAGILIFGPSGSGKSDLALRLIMNKGCVLVSDDRTDLEEKDGGLQASCPDGIKGLLEIRGIGIKTMPFQASAAVKLAVFLENDNRKIERLPEREFYCFGHSAVEKITLCPFEASAPDKIVIKMDSLLD